MSIRRDILGVVLHSAAWISAYYLMIWMFQHSGSRTAYGLISGWWLALYVARLAEIAPRSAIWAFAGCLITHIFVAFLWPDYLGELAEKIDHVFLLWAVVRSLVFASPIVVNELAWMAVGKIRSKMKSAT